MRTSKPLWVAAHVDDRSGRLVLELHEKDPSSDEPDAVQRVHLDREAVREIVRAYDRSRWRRARQRSANDMQK